jgi:hypothetical protein
MEVGTIKVMFENGAEIVSAWVDWATPVEATVVGNTPLGTGVVGLRLASLETIVELMLKVGTESDEPVKEKLPGTDRVDVMLVSEEFAYCVAEAIVELRYEGISLATEARLVVWLALKEFASCVAELSTV